MALVSFHENTRSELVELCPTKYAVVWQCCATRRLGWVVEREREAESVPEVKLDNLIRTTAEARSRPLNQWNCLGLSMVEVAGKFG